MTSQQFNALIAQNQAKFDALVQEDDWSEVDKQGSDNYTYTNSDFTLPDHYKPVTELSGIPITYKGIENEYRGECFQLFEVNGEHFAIDGYYNSYEGFISDEEPAYKVEFKDVVVQKWVRV